MIHVKLKSLQSLPYRKRTQALVLTTLSSTREKNQHLSQQTSLDPFQLSIIMHPTFMFLCG